MRFLLTLTTLLLILFPGQLLQAAEDDLERLSSEIDQISITRENPKVPRLYIFQHTDIETGAKPRTRASAAEIDADPERAVQKMAVSLYSEGLLSYGIKRADEDAVELTTLGVCSADLEVVRQGGKVFSVQVTFRFQHVGGEEYRESGLFTVPEGDTVPWASGQPLKELRQNFVIRMVEAMKEKGISDADLLKQFGRYLERFAQELLIEGHQQLTEVMLHYSKYEKKLRDEIRAKSGKRTPFAEPLRPGSAEDLPAAAPQGASAQAADFREETFRDLEVLLEESQDTEKSPPPAGPGLQSILPEGPRTSGRDQEEARALNPEETAEGPDAPRAGAAASGKVPFDGESHSKFDALVWEYQELQDLRSRVLSSEPEFRRLSLEMGKVKQRLRDLGYFQLRPRDKKAIESDIENRRALFRGPS